jgi:hypothetical protein
VCVCVCGELGLGVRVRVVFTSFSQLEKITQKAGAGENVRCPPLAQLKWHALVLLPSLLTKPAAPATSLQPARVT